MPAGRPVPLSGPSSQSLEGVGVRAGQTLRAQVQGQTGQLFVRLGGVRVALPASSGFQPGQQLALEVVQGESGLQLRAMAVPPAAAAPGAAESSVLNAALAAVLPRLGNFASQPQAAQLLPAALPLNERTVALLLAVFAGKRPLGGELAQLQGIVSSAVAARAVPAGMLANLSAALESLLLAPEAGVREMVQALVRQAGDRPPEAQLAQALQSGEVIEEGVASLMRNLRVQLAQLRSHAGLQRFAAAQGLGDTLRGLIDGLIDRLQSSQLQNLRGLEQPYQFAELFFAPGGPFPRAQLHIFGEGSGKDWRNARENATVVLDLDSEALGPLWVSLAIRAQRCQCTLRAQTGAAVQALRNNAAKLRDGLASAGYPGAIIRVQPWDGNRLGQTLTLMQRFAGIQERA